MIKASTAYALVTNEGEVIARGSSANMRKLARVLGCRVWLTSTPIGEKIKGIAAKEALDAKEALALPCSACGKNLCVLHYDCAITNRHECQSCYDLLST